MGEAKICVICSRNVDWCAGTFVGHQLVLPEHDYVDKEKQPCTVRYTCRRCTLQCWAVINNEHKNNNNNNNNNNNHGLVD